MNSQLVTKSESQKRITILAEHELHEAFLKTCRYLDTTGSQEIRKFMRNYVVKNGQRKLL